MKSNEAMGEEAERIWASAVGGLEHKAAPATLKIIIYIINQFK